MMSWMFGLCHCLFRWNTMERPAGVGRRKVKKWTRHHLFLWRATFLLSTKTLKEGGYWLLLRALLRFLGHCRHDENWLSKRTLETRRGIAIRKYINDFNVMAGLDSLEWQMGCFQHQVPSSDIQGRWNVLCDQASGPTRKFTASNFFKDNRQMLTFLHKKKGKKDEERQRTHFFFWLDTQKKKEWRFLSRTSARAGLKCVVYDSLQHTFFGARSEPCLFIAQTLCVPANIKKKSDVNFMGKVVLTFLPWRLL